MSNYLWVMDKDKEVLLNRDCIKELYAEKIEDKELYQVIIVLKDGDKRMMLDHYDDIDEAEEEISHSFQDK